MPELTKPASEEPRLEVEVPSAQMASVLEALEAKREEAARKDAALHFKAASQDELKLAAAPWAALYPLNIRQRMLMAMDSITTVEKGKTANVETRSGGSYSYKFAGHDAVAAATHPVFVKCGIYPHPLLDSWEQQKDTTVFVGRIRFTNVDRPEDFIDVPGIGYGQDAGDKGPGKAFSYLVKLAILKALLLESGDPDNEDAHDRRGSAKGVASGAGSGVASERSTRYMRVLLREKDRQAIRTAIKGGNKMLAAAAAYLGEYEKAKLAGEGEPKRPVQDVVSGAIEALKDMPDGGPAPEHQGAPGAGAEGSQEPQAGSSGAPSAKETQVGHQPPPEPGEGEWRCLHCDRINPISAPDCQDCGMPPEPDLGDGEEAGHE